MKSIKKRRRRAFGIDLSGYASRRTVCAEAEVLSDLEVRIRIIQGCPLSRRRNTVQPLKPIVDEEVGFLCEMLERGPVAVDVPIDLQGLPARIDPKAVWELTLRPIDKALCALPAFAEKIGAVTARFAHILHVGGLRRGLGESLFETYPGGTRRLLKRAESTDPIERDNSVDREAIVQAWGVEGAPLSADEIDAAICALTVLAPRGNRLEDKALLEELESEFRRREISRRDLPKGYVVLKAIPFRNVAVRRVAYSEWLTAKQ